VRTGQGRRDFLRQVLAIVLIRSTRFPRTVSRQSARPGRGRRHVNVRDTGARGDGVTDDTAAFAAAIAQLGPAGGTVDVPAGRYRIDPVRSIHLADSIAMEMASGAVLAALPVAQGNSAVIRLDGIQGASIRGGMIIGERDGHLGTAGEWGMGIQIMGGSTISVEGVRIEGCWGDGIYVGGRSGVEATHITIRRCVVTNNRRQGMSMTGCRDSLVEGCTFASTHGTAPQAGIDLEPNGGFVVEGVTIRGCTVEGNHGYGIVLSGGREQHVQTITLDDNRVADNGFHGIGVVSSVDCSVRGNTVEHNGRDGVQIAGSSRVRLTGNTIRDNSRRTAGVWDNVIVQSLSTDNTVANNNFMSAAIEDDREGPRYDVRIEPRCERTIVGRNHMRPSRGMGHHATGGLLDHGTATTAAG